MAKRGRSAIRKLVPLLSACLCVLPAGLAAAQPVRDLGTLTPFYRATQLQGHLIGMGLMDIPEYLTAPDIDLKYRKKPGMRREIPFVDSFTINRFLGGYREDWLRKFGLVDERLGRRSLDYVIRQPDGSLQYRPDLIRRRLQPYLDAGYRPADITIALDNVPWDLKTPGGRAPEAGVWGRRSPPGDLGEWGAVIRHFAADLKAYLGDAANGMHFETGLENDEKVSFDATAPEFFAYYEATDRALHSVLPGATLNPGEFTGIGACPPSSRTCVYDTADFLAFAAQHHLAISDVPRSLLSVIANPATAWPSKAAERARRSYQRLPSVVPEIHQFGLLGEPWGNQGMDTAALQANWEFQVLVRLWEAPKPRRVFHWGGFQTVGRMPFLNGAGFLRLVLDRYLGSRAYQLGIRDSSVSGRAEAMALGLTDGSRSAVIVSSFSPYYGDAKRVVHVELPANVLTRGAPLRTIRYRQSDNVYKMIRDDLAADGNLRPEFMQCGLCLATPQLMARDLARARPMLARNWQRYVAVLKQHLRWIQGDAGVARSGPELQVTLEPNELIVVE